MKFWSSKNGHSNGTNGEVKEATPSVQPDGTTTDGKAKEKIIYVDEPNIWIKNDGLLRDEGVLFGLSHAEIDDKVEAINKYYDQQKAPLSAAITNADERTSQLSEEIAAIHTKIDLANSELSALKNAKVSYSGILLFRFLFGLALMIISCYGSFFLIDKYITPAFGLMAAWSIFLFGLFAQINPVSKWLQKGEEEKSSKLSIIKEQLLEMGPPISATVLTSYIVYLSTENPLLTTVIGLFLLFLFFYNGKLILGLTQSFLQTFRDYSEKNKEQKRIKREKKLKEQYIKELDGSEKKIGESIQTISIDKYSNSSKLKELEEEQANKVKVFISEYKFARHLSTNSNLNGYE